MIKLTQNTSHTQRGVAALLGATILALMLAIASCSAQPIAPPPSAQTNATPEAAVAQETTPADAAVAVTDTTATTDTTTGTTAPAQAAPSADVATGVYNDMPVGFTADGFPFRGSPDAAVTMVEYSDFQCPFCSRYFVQTEPSINENYVRTGKVRVVFHDMPLVELHPNAPAAHEATLCIADQGAELYWAFHDDIFRTQTEWSNSADPAPVFARLAESTGANMDNYNACVAGSEKEAIVQQRVDAAFGLGFSGTPSFRFASVAQSEAFDLIGAQPYDQFATMIDALLAGEKPANAATNEPEQQQGASDIPFWATTEGLQPDPDRPGYNMAGDEYHGNLEAKVTVIEFSDFQCPYCGRHSLETQPALDEKFVDSGQVLWVFKHFPLTIHPQAPAAGAAAECAADQGKFWEMHNLLFQNVESWSVDDPTSVFVDLAQQLSLDAGSFQSCLTSPEAADRVASDMNDGAPFVRGTPTFIVLKDNRGQIVPGALPLESFEQLIQQVLDAPSGS